MPYKGLLRTKPRAHTCGVRSRRPTEMPKTRHGQRPRHLSSASLRTTQCEHWAASQKEARPRLRARRGDEGIAPYERADAKTFVEVDDPVRPAGLRKTGG